MGCAFRPASGSGSAATTIALDCIALLGRIRRNELCAIDIAASRAAAVGLGEVEDFVDVAHDLEVYAALTFARGDDDARDKAA